MPTTRPVPTGTVLQGDALERLRDLPDESVDTIITSPPYFMLRNYFATGQIGLEDNVQHWVRALVDVFEEAKRVLKPSGCLWLNLGDTYARRADHGAPPKSLLLGPERLLLALSAAGWIVRSKVVWAKPNPMPAPVKDRLSCTWEPVFLLTKSPRYFFDLDAIRMPGRSVRAPLKKQSTVTTERPKWAGPLAGSNSGLVSMRCQGQSTHPLGKNPGDVWTIPTSSYHGAHFATFPATLLERPILASCPARTCSTCGTPWWRAPMAPNSVGAPKRGRLRKSCSCSSRAHRPGVVLDPFMGAGTTALAAERHGRRWVGIELNSEFIDLTNERLQTARAPERDTLTMAAKRGGAR